MRPTDSGIIGLPAPGDSGGAVPAPALPAFPGPDTLFAPFQQLLGSFGTGLPNGFDPAALLSEGSKYIEAAVSAGSDALATVESLWSGESCDSARVSGRDALTGGCDTARRGAEISSITTQAAAAVQKGNLELTGIARQFLTEAAALAPAALTPAGQTALIASAAQHLSQALAVVTATRSELSGYTGQLHTIIGEQLGLDRIDAAEMVQSLVTGVGEPLAEQARSLLESRIVPAATTPEGVTAAERTESGPGTLAAGLNPGGPLGGGSPGGPFGGTPSVPGGPGSAVPGGKVTPAAGPFAAGPPALTGMSGAGFMGVPGGVGMGRGGADPEYTPTVRSHRSPSDESEFTGNLGTFSPAVLGADEQSEIEWA